MSTMAEQPPAAVEYQWAHEKGALGMARPEVLEAHGFVKVRRHPFWPASWLMRRGDPAWPINSTS